MTTKKEAREAIREARQTLRDLEATLGMSPADVARYFDAVGTEPIASLCTAFYDVCAALGRDSDGEPLT